MRAEHLQGWLVVETRNQDLYIGHWDRVVNLAQISFTGVTLYGVLQLENGCPPAKGG